LVAVYGQPVDFAPLVTAKKGWAAEMVTYASCKHADHATHAARCCRNGSYKAALSTSLKPALNNTSSLGSFARGNEQCIANGTCTHGSLLLELVHETINLQGAEIAVTWQPPQHWQQQQCAADVPLVIVHTVLPACLQ
jgi:hypothetical protein